MPIKVTPKKPTNPNTEGPDKTKPGKRPNIIQMTPEQREKRFNTPFRPKGKPVMAPKPREIPRAKSKTRIKRMGGGLMAATKRLKRQGLKRGGGVCIRGLNRDAVGKNS